MVTDFTLFSDEDLYYFQEGTHLRLYEKLGAHRIRTADLDGVFFAVWAPNAEAVAVTGSFNDWNKSSHPLKPLGASGIWGGLIPGIPPEALYKYHVRSRFGDYRVDKADPVGFRHELPPKTASQIWELNYDWNDRFWMEHRHHRHQLSSPISIYEVHLGSWMRVPEENNRSLTYRELAPKLAEYVERLGFSHVELLPIMEHPFYGSWGYQTTGYFAPTSRYGTPQDFMYLIDYLHQSGIGVILDWVPSHFPNDEHGLAYFDGTYLFEHSDPRQGYHPDWNSNIFNYNRHEVRSFLLSSAMFWLDKYHIDALRVDAVASMLYLDYSRKQGEWIPNEFGGRENLHAISFLRRLNEEVYRHYPDTCTVAEESTAWPMVSRPTYIGGLGFGFKWDMGWMHDMLVYMSHDPIHRKYHHNQLTFRGIYAHSENFILPLSHDEVVHGKGSLVGKMPGDEWQRFANLRLLFACMYAQPGKKLIFMGSEFGQWSEWNHDSSLDWHLAEHPSHRGIQRTIQDLNSRYRSEPALHEGDATRDGFEWIDCNDSEQSTLAFLRWNQAHTSACIAAFNFTPLPRPSFRIGVPFAGFWEEIFNSDSKEYGGSGHGNLGGVQSIPFSWHGRPHAIHITLPPLGAVFLRCQR